MKWLYFELECRIKQIEKKKVCLIIGRQGTLCHELFETKIVVCLFRSFLWFE